MFGRKKESQPGTQVDSGSEQQYVQNVDPLVNENKSTWQSLWPVFACGAGLFSDGYINNVRLSAIANANKLLT
jgi:hypothetical protein